MGSLTTEQLSLIDSLFIARFSVWGFPDGSDGKASACLREAQVRYLGWEDPLERK